MAGGFWLPKVVVVFALFFPINYAHTDDLLDRVRLSKSNDPEIREFLQSVLKHHGDFRWIHHEANKLQHDDEAFGKNRRAFYASRGGYPQGYAGDSDALGAQIESAVGQQDAESVYGDNRAKAEQMRRRQQQQVYLDDVDFDGPVNDIYPYQDDLNPAQNDRRLVRNSPTEAHVMYEDDHPDGDFFDDGIGPDATANADLMRYADQPDNEEFDYMEDKASGPSSSSSTRWDKRASNTEELLNEKLMLHSLLHKDFTRKNSLDHNYNIPTMPPIGDKEAQRQLSMHLPGDAIEVIPNSDKGVRFAPGLKYEKFGEFIRNEQEQYNEVEPNVVEASDDDGAAAFELAKRKCTDTLEEHDFKVPELFGPNASQSSDFDAPMGEFYYSQPHDVLGMNQDVQSEQRGYSNGTSKKIKRSLSWDGFHAKGAKDNAKKRKAIKIKIFDDGQLVKDIQKGEGLNSIVLTIKNDKHPTTNFHTTMRSTMLLTSPEVITENHQYYNDLQFYSNSLYANPDVKANNLAKDDRTLEKIDDILQRDAASLKMNSVFNKNQPSSPLLEDKLIRETSHHNMAMLHDSFHHAGSTALVVIPRTTHKYSRINEMGTSVMPLYPALHESSSLQPFYKSYDVTIDNVKQNHLEDQTEPTSAAEQRELGKINNKFNTLPTNMQSTTEKTIIIPLKKSPKSLVTNNTPNKFKHRCGIIDPTADRDMAIRVMVDNKLKDSEDVLGKLRNDLEQTFKGTLMNNDLRNSRELLRNMQNLHRNLIRRSEEKEKRSDDVTLCSNEIYDPEISQKAEAFRSRKLFSIQSLSSDNFESDPEIDPEKDDTSNKVNPSSPVTEVTVRIKKDIRNFLGMHKDEDYSEDRSDIYDEKKKRHNSKAKSDEKAANQTHLKFFPFTSLISSQQERLALKSRLARTKPSKVKKEITIEIDDALDDDDEISPEDNGGDNVMKRDNYRHVVIKDHESDGRKDPESMGERNFEYGSSTDRSNERNADRCCVNDPSKSTTCGPHQGDSNLGPPSHSGQSQEGGGANELDIIEKTQAILLHITGPPAFGEASGNLDDNDDPSLKRNNNDDTITIKRLNSYKVSDNGDKNPDDMVSEIIKLVQNYKSKINQNNKLMNGHEDKSGTSMVKNYEKTSNRENLSHDTKKDNSPNPNDIDERFDSTTNDFKDKESEISENYEKINLSEDEDDSSIHAHAGHHSKKAHPTKTNKCEMKEGTDTQLHGKINKFVEHDEEFIVPIVVKEGYAKPEVVADTDTGESEMLTEEPHPEDDIKKTQKRAYPSLDNPLRFTPDNLDSFKEIVESVKQSKSDDSELNSESRVKRDTDTESESEYSDEEIDKLLSMTDEVADTSEEERKPRIRRYNYDKPYYYETYPRYRQVKMDSSPPPSVKNTKKSAAAGSTMTVFATTARQERSTLCPKSIDTHTKAPKKRKKTRRKNKCDFSEEEFRDLSGCGDEYSKKHSHDQVHKDHVDRAMRERTREKIYQDNLAAKQKEQEHIKNVLNGHLVLEIMDKFQNRVKERSRLNNRFGQSMGKKCANEEVNFIDKYRDEQSKADVRHAQLMLHQVIVLMNKIVAEQVHRRTCLTLSPTLKSYLKRITSVKNAGSKSKSIAEGYPLPTVKGGSQREQPMDEKQGDFLFPPESDQTPTSPIEAMRALKRKINMIRALLTKYNHMSHNCQVKVQPVHDYLVDHLRMLERLYKNKQFEPEVDECDVKCLRPESTSPSPGTSPVSGGPKGARGHTKFGATTRMKFSTRSLSTAANASTTSASPPAARAVLLNNPYMPKHEQANSNGFVSDKYKKLVDAAATYRRKRQIEERLARLFGHSKTKSEETTQHSQDNLDTEELNNIAFEAPLVYSLH